MPPPPLLPLLQLLLLLLAAPAQAIDNGLGLSPPMGWSANNAWHWIYGQEVMISAYEAGLPDCAANELRRGPGGPTGPLSASRRGPLGPSPDRESVIGNAPALVSGPRTFGWTLRSAAAA
jgi:hypothetical protein